MDVRSERRAILAQVGVIVDAACFYPNLTASEFPANDGAGRRAARRRPLLIQHAISWRVCNLVLPLAVGVAATIGIGSAAGGGRRRRAAALTAFVLGRRETET